MVSLNSVPAVPTQITRPIVPERYRNASLFVLLAFLFGSGFVAIEAGLRELPPVLFASLRFYIGAFALLSYVVLTRGRSAWLPRTRGDLLGVGVAALFLVALNNGLLFLGQGTIPPGMASIMYGLNPVLAPVFAWWLLGNRLSWPGAVGIGIALAGVVLIVQPSSSTVTDASAGGQLLVMGAAAAAALGSVLLQRVGPQMENIALTGWGMAAGAVVLHVISLAAGEPQSRVVGIAPVTALSLLVIGVPSTAVAYAIHFGLLARVGPVRANLVAYIVPVFAALTGWAVLGATVSAWTAVGFLVVVVGFAVVERETLRREVVRLRARSASGDQTPSAAPPSDD